MSLDLATRAALTDLNARFAWALDRHDWIALGETLAPDVDYVSVGRNVRGREAVVASFQRRPAGRITRHGLGNLLLEEVSERAVRGLGSWHTFARNGDSPPGVPLFMVADFADTYMQADGGAWRISTRYITPVFRDDALAPLPAEAG